VTENVKDYSDYIQYASNLASILSLLGGFTFTAFTILLTLLPDPSNIISQFTLIFLAGLFYLFMSLLGWIHMLMIRYGRNVPPVSRGISIFNSLVPLSYVGLGFAMVLMLLIWGLIYLALASGVVWMISIILSDIYLTRPFLKYRKTIH